MPRNIGYATPNAITPLAPLEFDRPEVGPHDIRMEIKYCGVCHSDVHQARDEWGGGFATNYPSMPGHELARIVAEIGADVTTFKVGDRVGVGCMIDSDGTCAQCLAGQEQYCESVPTLTYNTKDTDTGLVTFGGYSDEIVVKESFVLRIPDSIPLEKAGPILCAGITTYSPLKHWNVGHGTTIGVAGVGGLGHMAIHLAKALGAYVIALTTTEEKSDDATRLGADAVIVMSDEEAVAGAALSINFLLSTIPTAHDVKPYLSMVKHDGQWVSVGMLEPIQQGGIDFGTVSMYRQSLAGSFIGGIAETQEVLDFCAAHSILPETRTIPIQDINDAFDAIVAKDARYRFVIDNSTLRP